MGDKLEDIKKTDDNKLGLPFSGFLDAVVTLKEALWKMRYTAHQGKIEKPDLLEDIGTLDAPVGQANWAQHLSEDPTLDEVCKIVRTKVTLKGIGLKAEIEQKRVQMRDFESDADLFNKTRDFLGAASSGWFSKPSKS